jgi:hypothetical protein
VVIRGCVERADEVMPLAGAALGTTVDSQEFVLIHARPAGAAAEAPAVGTSGTAASRGGVADPNGFGQVYRIDAAKTLINPHVGHEVEVTGTRDEPGTRTDARADATGTGTGEAPRLRVQSVKVIADTCGSRR